MKRDTIWMPFKKYSQKTNHPSGFYICTGTEIWERLGFFLIQSVLVLYLLHDLKFNDVNSYSLYRQVIREGPQQVQMHISRLHFLFVRLRLE